MRTNQDSLEERIDSVTPETLREKPEILTRMRARFDNFQRLLARLPPDEQDKVFIIFADELLEVELAFTHVIAGKLTADEVSKAFKKVPTDGGESLRAAFRKELDLVMGKG